MLAGGRSPGVLYRRYRGWPDEIVLSAGASS